MTEEHSEDPLFGLRDDIRDEVQAGAADAAKHEVRRWTRWITPCLAVLCLCVSLLAVLGYAEVGSRIVAQNAELTATRKLAEDAHALGATANKTLSERGQATVPIPAPGTTGDTEVLVAAATARVLASLPDLRPTAAELGGAVARYLSLNPIPAPQLVVEAVAAYFAANPPPSGAPGRDCDPAVIPECRGPQGEKGDKGDPPTAQEIQAALEQYIRENPNVLCPRGGSFAQLRVQLADGGIADTWTCVVQVAPSTTTTTSPPLLRPGG